MKNLIQTFGDSFITIIAAIAYIGVVVNGIAAMQGYTGSFMGGILVIIGGFISVTMVFYILFVLIDIRDSLREIKKQ